MIGPLSGDESIAVANYAKQHPDKTFVDGSAGAQDTTLKVQAPNFFRFNGDGAQWNAGLGDIAYNKLGWKTAAVVADDYSFAWTSAAGFIAEFCAVGGKVTKRVFPPLNTTDYSSYAQQMPTDVDGTFVAVGGAGLIPFLKAYEQAQGPDRRPRSSSATSSGAPRVSSSSSARASRAPTSAARARPATSTRRRPRTTRTNIIGKWFKIDPAGQDAAAPQASSTFTYGYYINTWGLIKGLRGGQGRHLRPDASSRPRWPRWSCRRRTARSSWTRTARRIITVYDQQLYTKDGKLAVKTGRHIPNVDQTFGGTFSEHDARSGAQLPRLREAEPPVGRQGAASPKVVGG